MKGLEATVKADIQRLQEDLSYIKSILEALNISGVEDVKGLRGEINALKKALDEWKGKGEGLESLIQGLTGKVEGVEEKLNTQLQDLKGFLWLSTLLASTALALSILAITIILTRHRGERTGK